MAAASIIVSRADQGTTFATFCAFIAFDVVVVAAAIARASTFGKLVSVLGGTKQA